MPNPTKLSWSDPTTNIDGSPIAPGEITGYQIGIRPAAGTAGTYPTLIPAAATVTTVPIPTLAAGSYASAIQTTGPVDSAWSGEITFSIAETPNPPSGFGAS